MRYFAVARGWEGKDIQLPKRSTEFSAGYDIEAAEDTVVPSIWKMAMRNLLNGESIMKPTMVPTGVKVYMEDDEVLEVYPRSSNAIKKYLTMPNSVGVIDSDYVDNPANDGAIGVPLWNFGLNDLTIAKHERIAQGIFVKFLKVDDDDKASKASRLSGFGSTGDFNLENI